MSYRHLCLCVCVYVLHKWRIERHSARAKSEYYVHHEMIESGYMHSRKAKIMVLRCTHTVCSLFSIYSCGQGHFLFGIYPWYTHGIIRCRDETLPEISTFSNERHKIDVISLWSGEKAATPISFWFIFIDSFEHRPMWFIFKLQKKNMQI